MNFDLYPEGGAYLSVNNGEDWKGENWNSRKTDTELAVRVDAEDESDRDDADGDGQPCCCPSELDDDDEDEDQELSDIDLADEVKIKKKRPKNCCWQAIKFCYLSFQASVKALVENKWFQQALLGAILINTLSMGIEYHNQVTSFNSFTLRWLDFWFPWRRIQLMIGF